MREKEEIAQKGLETNGCNTERRKALKNIAVGVGALAGISMLPERWSSPVIGQIAIPAHAQTSGVVEPEPQTQPQRCSAPGDCYFVDAGGPNDLQYMLWAGGRGPHYIDFYADGCSGEAEFTDVPMVLAASQAQAERLLSNFLGGPANVFSLTVANAPEGCTFYVSAN